MAVAVRRPRVMWVPPRSRSLGAECAEFWRASGGRLFEWQELVLDGIMGLGSDDRWVTGNDGLCVARQNGKGVVLQALELFCAFELDYPVVMHTAHEFATSQEHQFRLEAFIQECPELHSQVRAKGGYMHANGQESIRLRSGSRIVFKARTKGGGRGYSGDLLVWDEAMVLPVAVVAAQKPMLRASQSRFGPKTVYAGSAVDQEIHEHGVPFALIRKRGMDEAPAFSYFEWSAPYESLGEMTEEVLFDRAWWPMANPSMDEGLIQFSHMQEELESMPARSAAVELGCVGDWPETDPALMSVIRRDAWRAVLDKHSKAVDPVVFAFDVAPSRAVATIGVAGKREDGLAHVEVVDSRPGTGWVVDRLVELVGRHETAGVVCDAVGPAVSLVPELERRDVRVSVTSTKEYARACALFFDGVEQATLRHRGDQELDDGVKGAATRPLGEGAWAWSRKNSKIDISGLVACSLALGHLLTKPPSKLYVGFTGR